MELTGRALSPGDCEVSTIRIAPVCGILLCRARAPGASVMKNCGSSADLSRLDCHAISSKGELQQPCLGSLCRGERPLLGGLHCEIRKVAAWSGRCELCPFNIAASIDVRAYRYFQLSPNGSESFLRDIGNYLTDHLIASVRFRCRGRCLWTGGGAWQCLRRCRVRCRLTLLARATVW